VKTQPKGSILGTLQERLPAGLGTFSLIVLLFLLSSGCKFSDLDLHVKDGDLGGTTGALKTPVPITNSVP
jgi:hypothetical protein